MNEKEIRERNKHEEDLMHLRTLRNMKIGSTLKDFVRKKPKNDR